MKRIVIAILLAFLTSPSTADDFQSTVSRVIDGDTFQLSRPLVRIRLCGVDTPERGRPGYREATTFTKAAVSGKTVTCVPVGDGTPCDGRSRKKSGQRFVAQCFVDGEDIAMMLAKAGLACDWPKYSGGHYSQQAACSR